MIALHLASRDDLRRMQATVTAHHSLHRPRLASFHSQRANRYRLARSQPQMEMKFT